GNPSMDADAASYVPHVSLELPRKRKLAGGLPLGERPSACCEFGPRTASSQAEIAGRGGAVRGGIIRAASPSNPSCQLRVRARHIARDVLRPGERAALDRRQTLVEHLGIRSFAAGEGGDHRPIGLLAAS